MADTEEPSPATLLDQLASLDPQERRKVAAIVRRLSENLAEDTPTGPITPAIITSDPNGFLAGCTDSIIMCRASVSPEQMLAP